MDETQGIVPVSNVPSGRKAPRPARPGFELALCVLGSLCSLTLPALGMAAMVFGAWLLARKDEGRIWWAVAGCAVPGIILSFVSWVNYGSLVAPFIVGALTIALLLPGRVTITNVCLTIVGVAALMVAGDASVIMMMGSDFATYVAVLLDEMRDVVVASLGGTSQVAVSAAVDQTIELFGKVWALMYVTRAAVAVLMGLLGLMLARRDTYQKVYAAFTRFDMPLWGVVGLIAGIACLALATAGFSGAAAFEAVGLNILFCLRVLYFLQGLAVAMYLMDARHWGPVSRVLVLAVLLMAELGLYAVSVFGVIDVWANFRGLPRDNRGKRAAEPCGEGE